MHGDFTRWTLDEPLNWNGVLHQQGRVLLDTDVSDQTRHVTRWQDIAARDAFGPLVAAVPESVPDSSLVTQANLVDGSVQLDVSPGRVWASGVLAHLRLDGTPTYRVATYYDLPTDVAAENTRDAVILEVWREALNGFQTPADLIEPALGGPDTTERLMTAFAFRLERMEEGENCDDVVARIQDDLDSRGHLTVQLQPSTTSGGDCPTVEGGGYTGFEHHLYRIEIAQTDNDVKFKWSRFNGGLVGRGKFKSGGAPDTVEIQANRQAILRAGLTNFYIEALEPVPDRGEQSLSAPLAEHWRVSFGAEATLNSDGVIEIGTVHFGLIPSSDQSHFFRVWDGIRPVSEFPVANVDDEANELEDGIRLGFDVAPGTDHQYGDFWTFKVRAGDVGNDQTLLDNAAPEGVGRIRVALAELNWDGSPEITYPDQIEDCRRIFRPLTDRNHCCTFHVGDGDNSHGDFDSIQEAVNHLPDDGGQICLLPGLHRANVQLTGRRNIAIKGCDKRTIVVPRDEISDPIFEITDSTCITLVNMNLLSHRGTCILAHTSQGIEIAHNRILACKDAVRIEDGVDVDIHNNHIRVFDKDDGGIGIVMLADQSKVRRNDIGVVPADRVPPPPRDPERPTPDPEDPCAELDEIYTNYPFLIFYFWKYWLIPFVPVPPAPYKAMGGIQILGGSDILEISDNEINGGASNGISLGGSLPAVDEGGNDQPPVVFTNDSGFITASVSHNGMGVANFDVLFTHSSGVENTVTTNAGGLAPYFDALNGEYEVLPKTPGWKITQVEITSSTAEFGTALKIDVEPIEIDFGDRFAFIYDVDIDRNRIENMGLSGIGIPRVDVPSPDASPQERFVANTLAVFGNPCVNLKIRDNHIEHCFLNPLDESLRAEVRRRGLGGVALGMCEDLLVMRNSIVNNGRSAFDPVCGIFVAYVEQAEITHNHVEDNGPPVLRRLTLTRAVAVNALAANTIPLAGRRGGIVMLASSMAVVDRLEGESDFFLRDNPAARVHDNIVSQPMGQALALGALGPVSVVNNRFNSEVSGPEPMERLVGTVLILNLGGIHEISNQQRMNLKSVSSVRLPSGVTLFNNNQTRYGPYGRSFCSQLIYSLDDLSMDGNQSVALGPGLNVGDSAFAINTMCLARTLRCSDNRFKEPFTADRFLKLSLYSYSLILNATTGNQADHCIVAASAGFGSPADPLINKDNQIIDDSLCRPAATFVAKQPRQYVYMGASQ